MNGMAFAEGESTVGETHKHNINTECGFSTGVSTAVQAKHLGEPWAMRKGCKKRWI